MYLFNQKVLNKFLLLSLRISDIKAIDIIDDLSHILEDLFLIRAAREVLKIDVAMLDNFGKCCTWNNSRTKFQFDIQGYLNKYINKSQINANKSTFLDKIEELRIKAQNLEDRRYKIHGHDFTELLYVYIKDFLRKEIKSYTSDILASSLLGCVDAQELLQELMFQRLLSRMNYQ